jgi:hypothetical protein
VPGSARARRRIFCRQPALLLFRHPTRWRCQRPTSPTCLGRMQPRLPQRRRPHSWRVSSANPATPTLLYLLNLPARTLLAQSPEAPGPLPLRLTFHVCKEPPTPPSRRRHHPHPPTHPPTHPSPELPHCPLFNATTSPIRDTVLCGVEQCVTAW